MTNKIKVEGLTITATTADLKKSKCVIKKIGFSEQESAAIAAAGIDLSALNEAKAAGNVAAASAAGIVFFKVDAKGANNGAIAAMIDGDKQLFINENCDFATMGAGGIATRLRLAALYNAFLDTFSVADAVATEYDGVVIKCEKSLVDDRRAGKAADVDAVAW